MASSESENETRNELINEEELNVFNKLEAFLKARNKKICCKEIRLPCALSEDTNLDLLNILNDNTPNVVPNKRLKDHDNFIVTLKENVQKLKRNSELAMNFDINEGKTKDDEINQAISRLRQDNEKLFKKIINTQIGFNECITNDHYNIKKHYPLIEQTCKFDRGIQSIIRTDKDILAKSFGKDLKTESVDQFKNVCNNFAKEVLHKVYETGAKSSKNHEHLLAIKEYNKSTTAMTEEDGEIITSGTLDPFTRKPITKPVCNKVCQHIYDENSVNQMFQAKSFVSCPYIGCGNKRFTKKDLMYNFNDND